MIWKFSHLKQHSIYYHSIFIKFVWLCTTNDESCLYCVYKQQMLRLLRGNGSFLKFNYLRDHKKPITELPTSIPPKYIYQVAYHPTSLPDFDMKFPDHKHFDDWKMIVYGEEDKFQFQYSGQWWNAIGVSGRVIIIVSMVWLWIGLNDSAEERKKKHLPGLLSYYAVGDVPINHLPTYIQA